MLDDPAARRISLSGLANTEVNTSGRWYGGARLGGKQCRHTLYTGREEGTSVPKVILIDAIPRPKRAPDRTSNLVLAVNDPDAVRLLSVTMRVMLPPMSRVSAMDGNSAIHRRCVRNLSHAEVVRAGILLVCCLCLALLATACTPSGPVQNVLTLRLRERLGTWPPPLVAPLPGQTGAIEGLVLAENAQGAQGMPVANASVVVAGPTGAPFAARTDVAGRYRIDGIPPGSYVPAAVAPGMEEETARGALGVAWPLPVAVDQTTEAPPIRLRPLQMPSLPEPSLLDVVQVGATRVVTSPFPAGAIATRGDWRFVRAGVAVDTLRLYLPVHAASRAGVTEGAEVEPAARRPLFLMVYPSHVDGWESVSVAFAAQGYNVLAISPVAERAADIEGHAQDARLALHLAQSGLLGDGIDGGRYAVLGGSYSSAIVYRLLRSLAAESASTGQPLSRGWVTVGGIANAFRGTADYWAGRLEIPEWHADAIPALGLPNVQPLPFLRYSPVYAAGEMPPTLIIHTAADRVVPIDQAQELATALERVGVPVEFYTYDDTSHYLQVGTETTAAGKAMFDRISAFLHDRLGNEETE